MEIVTKKIDDIKEYKNNPRNNDEAVEYVANSIKEFGFKVPVIVDKDNVVVAGHTRIRAAKQIGLTEIPCIVAEDLSDEQIKAFRLADNKVAEISTWDLDMLSEELGEILDLNMADFGFDNEEPEIKDLSDSMVDKYEIIISCKSEIELEEAFGELTAEGYECKISTY